jgi:23S rRNA pseudouridine2605 synthase
MVPLNRALSKLGILSRAQATEAIRAGRVRVDGRIVRDPATLVVPERIRVTVDGTATRRAAWRTLLFHKPRGVVTTRSDPDGRPTIYDVIGDAARGLVPVGRLDFATTGLLLLTSDTRLADWITDPKNAIPRVYAVTVRGRIAAEDVGHNPVITVRKSSTRETHLIVELRQGRNREVRRLFDDIGHEVTRLKRVAFGGLTLGNLAPGDWKELTRKEIAEAFLTKGRGRPTLISYA